MAEFDVGVNLTPEPGSIKRFETEAVAVANRIEPIIQKAFTITQAQAKKMVAPLEAALKQAFEKSNKAIAIKVGVDKASVSKVQQEIQSLVASKTVPIKVAVDQSGVANVQKQLAGVSGQKIGASVDAALVPSLERAQQSLGRFSGATRDSTASFARFVAGFAGIGILSAGFAGLAQAAVQAGTTLDTQLRGLQALSTTLGATATESFNAIRRAANELPGTFSDIQAGVVQLSSVLGLNLNQSIAFFRTLTGAALASGKGMGEVNGVIRQLGQISAKGRVQLEELSIIAENIPGLKVADVIAQIAKQMGITTEEARSLLKNGLLPSSEALEAIDTVAKNVPGALEAIALAADGLQTNLDTLKDSIQVGLGQAFIDATAAAGGGKATFGQLAGVAEQLLSNLTPVLTTLIQLVPVITALGGSLNAVLIPVNVLAKAFNLLGPALQPLITGFAIFKTIQTIIAGVNVVMAAFQARLLGTSVAAATAKAAIDSENKAVITAAGAFFRLNTAVSENTKAELLNVIEHRANTAALVQEAEAAGAATLALDANAVAATNAGRAAGVAAASTRLAGFATSALSAAAPVLTGVAVAWSFISAENEKATSKAKEYIDLVSKGIPIDDLERRREALRDVIKEQEKAAEPGFFKRELENLNPFDDSTNKRRRAKARKEEAEERLRDLELEEQVVGQIATATGSTYAEAYNAAVEQGVDFSILDDLSAKERDKVTGNIIAAIGNDKITKAAEEQAQKVADAYSKAFSTIDKVTSAAEAVKSANEGLAAAEKNLADANQRVNELLAKKAELLKDTARDARELADANRAVERSEIALRELLEDQADLPEDLAALQDERTAAVIRYNQALRKQAEAQEELNEKSETGVSVNLAGLSATEIQTALANARLGISSQTAKESKKETKEKKTQAELDEEAFLAAKEVRDAKRAIEGIDDRILDNNQRQADIVGEIADATRTLEDRKEDARKKAAGDTTRAKELRDIELQIKDANEQSAAASKSKREAEEAVSSALLDQRQSTAEILGDNKELNDVVLDRIDLLAKEDAVLARRALADSLPAILRESKITNIDPDTGRAISIAGLSPEDKAALKAATVLSDADIAEIVRLLLSAPPDADPRKLLREILRRKGLKVEGLKYGGIVGRMVEKFGKGLNLTEHLKGFASGGLVGTDRSLKGGQLIVAGEGGKEELILPLRGTKERAVELLNAAIRVSNPEIATLLKRALGSKDVKGFRRGGIVGGNKTHFADGGIVSGDTRRENNPLGIIDNKLDIVGADVDDGFDAVTADLETQAQAISRLFGISRNLARTLVQQQAKLATLNTAVIGLQTAVTTTIPGQITTLGQRVTDVNARLLALEGVVANVGTSVADNLVSQIDKINAVSKTLSTTFATTSTQQITAVQKEISKVVTAITGKPGGLEEILTQLNGDIQDFGTVLEALARKFGVTFLPGGAAEGAVITGTPGAYGQVIRVGEFNRAESIVPLRSKEDTVRVLRNSIPYAIPGVQDMLTRALTPEQPGLDVTALIPMRVPVPVEVPVPVRVGGIVSTLAQPEAATEAVTKQSVPFKSAAQEKNERLQWAEAIGESVARSLIAKGVGQGESGPITVVIEGTQYSELDAKNLVRAIERKKNRY